MWVRVGRKEQEGIVRRNESLLSLNTTCVSMWYIFPLRTFSVGYTGMKLGATANYKR